MGSGKPLPPNWNGSPAKPTLFGLIGMPLFLTYMTIRLSAPAVISSPNWNTPSAYSHNIHACYPRGTGKFLMDSYLESRAGVHFAYPCLISLICLVQMAFYTAVLNPISLKCESDEIFCIVIYCRKVLFRIR